MSKIKRIQRLDGVALSIEKENGDSLLYRAQNARELSNVMMLLSWIGDSSEFAGKFSIVTEVET